MRPLEISIKNCRAIAAEQACGSPPTARECHKQKNMKTEMTCKSRIYIVFKHFKELLFCLLVLSFRRCKSTMNINAIPIMTLR